MNPLSKTPFLFLLLALVVGIFLQYYGQNIIWSAIAFLLGITIVLFSFLIKTQLQYRFRWLFGVGIFLLFIVVGASRTYTKQESLNYPLTDSLQTYIGYVTDTPQDKPRSVACEVYVIQEDINIVCYLQKDSVQQYPKVGEEIIFAGKLQAFKNRGNPNDFDYEKYMYNKGFIASVYLPTSFWILTGEENGSLRIHALKVRQKIIELFAHLGFSPDEQAVLAALTLGYQDTLSDDLKQGFRTTGTVHVLSVSGLHVGIIYGVIALLLSFLPLGRRWLWLKPLSIILLLWIYSFLTGLSPSVVRASAMLTVFCFGEIVNRKGSSLNNLFIAAFFMLLYNPFLLFDIGFQLSCVSVLSILILVPIFTDQFKIKNKILDFFGRLLAVSISAQLATFPLCLYYFGTFPTYFFITNLLIVPLVSLITYGVILLVLLWRVITLFTLDSNYLWIPVEGLNFLLTCLTQFIRFFENLPYALIEEIRLSSLDLLIIYIILITFVSSLVKSSSRTLIVSLSFLSLFLVINIYNKSKERDERYLIVLNQYSQSEVYYADRGYTYSLDSLINQTENPVLNLGKYDFLIVNKFLGDNKKCLIPYHVDYAIMVGDQNRKLDQLIQLYNIDTLILDGSMKSYIRSQLTKECENKGLPVYDVTKKGAFRINF